VRISSWFSLAKGYIGLLKKILSYSSLLLLSRSSFCSQDAEFGLVGGLPGLGAFWLMCGSAFHDEAYNAFMTLPPYIRIRKGETRQLG
jgi:hypothetical protein